ncbi:MAG TPA: CvpA family protein [Terracidiphilus sp.]|jgi:membrane protein required for colicin V production|nr:CvpA family protein [Terracidiphilus sp.]
MTIIDWIIVAVLAGAVIAGIAQGFFRSACSLGGVILGLVLAAWNYGRLASLVKPAVRSSEVANTIAFLLIALLVSALAAAAGALLARLFQKLGLGCLDTLAGAIFGLFQGALLVTVFILVTVAFFPDAKWLTESRLPRYFFGACHLSAQVSPEGLRRLVHDDLNRLEHESPRWMHPGNRGQ